MAKVSHTCRLTFHAIRSFLGAVFPSFEAHLVAAIVYIFIQFPQIISNYAQFRDSVCKLHSLTILFELFFYLMETVMRKDRVNKID